MFRLHNPFKRTEGTSLQSRLDKEVRDEIKFYLEMRANELKAEGFSSDEAWRLALEAFGDPDQIAAETKQQREGRLSGWALEEIVMSFLQDLGFAVRAMRKHPTHTVAALLSLGLGIGVNVAVFSVVNAVLIRPLNVEDPDRLVPVHTSQAGGTRFGNTSYLDYVEYRERNEVFSGLVAAATAPMAVKGHGEARVLWGQLVSWDYFAVLGVEPVLGRGFLPQEDETFGTHAVAVLSFDTWTEQFGADPDILGRVVRINDSPFTVVGVAPDDFAGLMPLLEPALWAPLGMVGSALPYTPNLESRIDPWLQLVGRLDEGVTLADAEASLEVLSANLAAEFPETNGNKEIVLGELDQNRVFSPEATNATRSLLIVLLSIVGFVLLIACFNVANLQLAKAVSRRKEIAVRFSLGASRGRIVRQLLVESLSLALLASAFGLALAFFSLDVLNALQPQLEVPLEVRASMDARVLSFALLLTVTTGLLFGLAPAVQIMRPGQTGALKDQGLTVTHDRGRNRLQNGLVVAQVAMSVLLLASAGLFVRSMQNTLGIDPGFDLRNGAVVTLNLGYAQFEEAEGRELQRLLLERVRNIQGVQSAALTPFLPLGITHGHHDVYVEGYEPGPNELMLVKRNMVSSDYFETMGIRVLRGRAIDERETVDATPAAMINETMAQRFWPDRDPIGSTVWADLRTEFTVIGIVEDGKYGSLREGPEPYLILPLDQAEYVERANIVVRYIGDPRRLVPQLQSAVRELIPDLPPPTIKTIPDYLDYSLGDARTPALLVGMFGVLAFLLASVGLYGVISYTVNQRKREYGVRLALGATRLEVSKNVLGQGMWMTLWGVGIGVLLAVGASRMLSSLLFNVGSLDPVVFTVVPVGLILVGQVASYLPARQASRADPVVVLRAE